MTTPWQLYKYIAVQTLWGVVGLFIILTGLILLIDLIESLREVEKIEQAGFGFALKLTFLRTPKLALTLTPFIFLFGAMWAFFQMNRRSEIAVMRSAGMSVWEIISPAALLSFLIGMLVLTAADPLASKMNAQAEIAKNEIRGKGENLLKMLQGSIWLRQRDGDTALILHAKEYDPSSNKLSEVTLWKRSLEGAFIERWDADSAIIGDKKFELQNALLSTLDTSETEIRETQIVTSAFNLSDLKESVAKPETLSFWALPEFIDLAKDAGLPIVKYHLRYHDLISLPFKLFAMVLIAATFSMRPIRGGGTFPLILSGIVAGFGLFIFAELSNATAEAMVAPVWLAAWAPAALAVLISVTLLLYTEDG